MKNEQTRGEKGTIHRIVWYRARNEFSNKRATALCPAQHDNGNLSPSIIAPSLPISGAPISTAIGMLSIFSLPPPRYLFFEFPHESPSYIAIIRRASILPTARHQTTEDYFEKIFCKTRCNFDISCLLVSVSSVIFQ